ncbi:MAG: hypothetical protein M0R06_18460, partial [Sphaerochaeta sp.]|nr:hypothetical protein [Sphaerochaeta sp.]
GRYGDTMVAHINPREAAILQALGGKGSVNPRTGLREYWDSDAGDSMGGPADASAMGDTNDPSAGMSSGYGSLSSVEQEQADKEFGSSFGIGKESFDSIAELAHSKNTMMENVMDALTGLTPMQALSAIATYGLPALALASAFATGGLTGLIGAAVPSAVTGMMGKEAKSGFGFADMTPEEQSAAIAANPTDFGTADIEGAGETKWTKGKFNEQADETEGGTLNEDGSIKTTSDTTTDSTESETASLLKSLNYDVSDSDAQESISEDLKSMQDQISEKLQIVDLKGAVELGKEFTESATAKAKLARAMDNLSVLPGYEEIKDRMKALAMKYLEKGATPEIAAATAYEKLYSQLSQLQTLRSKYSVLLNK